MPLLRIEIRARQLVGLTLQVAPPLFQRRDLTLRLGQFGPLLQHRHGLYRAGDGRRIVLLKLRQPGPLDHVEPPGITAQHGH
jgi:hypothetical protein